jgi:hypothetical protein
MNISRKWLKTMGALEEAKGRYLRRLGGSRKKRRRKKLL